MKTVFCASCGHKMKKNGTTSAGRQRWRCPKCGASQTIRYDPTASRLDEFLGWLLSKDTQLDMPGQGRTFRRRTSAFWHVWPMPPQTGELHRVIYVDGIYLARNLVVLIASSKDYVLGWYMAESETARAWECLLAPIPAPSVVVSDGGSGFAKAVRRVWPETRVQRCVFHAFSQVKRYTTSRPRLQAGIELYRVAYMINSMPQDADSTEAAQVKTRMEAFFKDYDAKLDEATMAALLKNYREQVTERRYWPECYNTIDSLYGGNEAAYAHDVFSKTICLNTDAVDKVLADSTLRDTDLGLLYAADIPTKTQEISGRNRDASTTIDFNEHLLTQALLEMDQETPHYSDANFTMRLSYGYIQDYTASGIHHQYYTNAQSLLDKAAKQAEIEDYKLEDDIIALMSKGDWGRYADKTTGDMHLCFLSNNDITGGNSGSPMFNGKGELLGLAFDGNWDAMSGDISFDHNLQRCIGVDVRYMLFVMDKWGKAKNLIKELLQR